MKVLKFGGTSVGTLDALQRMKSIVADMQPPVVVVVSALGGMTDDLVQLALTNPADVKAIDSRIEGYRARFKPLISALIPRGRKPEVEGVIDSILYRLRSAAMEQSAPDRRHDTIVHFGEQLSSELVAAMLEGAVKFDALRLIHTESDHRTLNDKATFADLRTTLGPIPAGIMVVPGFIATAPDGSITNLGRGGSDYTAAIIACALNADELQIWTDVDGYMTADPRVDASATLLPQLTYEQAYKMSVAGAKVVYAPAIEIVRRSGVVLTVHNTFRPTAPFTVVADREVVSI